MKRRPVAIIAILLAVIQPLPAVRADMFGADVAVLAQILYNAVQQLYQLKQVVDAGKSNLNLMEEINRGINDSLSVAQTVFPNVDPGMFKDWNTVQAALRQLQAIYGMVPNSVDAQVQRNTDQSVAEAVSLNNSIYEYSKNIDAIGEQINSYSHAVSPGGATKLTAQGVGIMLNVMNQSLRAQATGLKLQAQAVAQQNRKEKLSTENYLSDANDLSSAMNTQDTNFRVPRF